jgi:WD40 repeat protein
MRTKTHRFRFLIIVFLTMLLALPVVCVCGLVSQIAPNESPIGIRAIVFSPDSRTLAIVRGELKPKKYFWLDGSRAPGAEYPTPLEFSPDGLMLAVGRAGIERKEHFSEVELWNLQTGRLARTLKFHTAPVTSKELDNPQFSWGTSTRYCRSPFRQTRAGLRAPGKTGRSNFGTLLPAHLSGRSW